MPLHGFERFKKTLTDLIYVSFALVLTYLGARFLLPLLAPFIFAYAVSAVIRPVVGAAQRRLRLPRGLTSILCMAALIAFLSCLLFLFFDRFFYELRGLLSLIADSSEEIVGSVSGAIKKVCGAIPFLRDRANEEAILSNLSQMGLDMLKNLSYKAPDVLGNVLTALPEALFVALSFIISLYYFSSMKTDGLTSLIERLPEGRRQTAKKLRARASVALTSVAKGYLLVLSVTFVLLFIAFSLIGIEYAFVLALITAIVDILPVLGIGTVLLPYAFFKLAVGEAGIGVGLLVTFLVVSVIREVIEPKLVGRSCGLHPLTTVAALYVGFRAAGFFGLIIAPVTAIIVKSILTSEKSNGNDSAKTTPAG